MNILFKKDKWSRTTANCWTCLPWNSLSWIQAGIGNWFLVNIIWQNWVWLLTLDKKMYYNKAFTWLSLQGSLFLESSQHIVRKTEPHDESSCRWFQLTAPASLPSQKPASTATQANQQDFNIFNDSSNWRVWSHLIWYQRKWAGPTEPFLKLQIVNKIDAVWRHWILRWCITRQ